AEWARARLTSCSSRTWRPPERLQILHLKRWCSAPVRLLRQMPLEMIRPCCLQKGQATTSRKTQRCALICSGESGAMRVENKSVEKGEIYTFYRSRDRDVTNRGDK